MVIIDWKQTISVKAGPGLALWVWDSLLGQQMFYSEFILTYGQKDVILSVPEMNTK